MYLGCDWYKNNKNYPKFFGWAYQMTSLVQNKFEDWKGIQEIWTNDHINDRKFWVKNINQRIRELNTSLL